MRTVIPVLCAFLSVILSGTHGAQAERRVALVIGNAAYTEVRPLQNSVNDAKAIAAALKRLNFQVVLATDVSQRELADPITNFVRLLQGADVALFYYSGHGLSFDDKNYLVPVDASANSYINVTFQMTPMNLILDEMGRAARVSLVFLDSCRESPFAAKLNRELAASTRSVSVGRGMVPIERIGHESLIAFATKPGDVAADGSGDHSPFARALLDNIEREGLPIEAVLKDVRLQVRQATHDAQAPEFVNRLDETKFEFKPVSTGNANDLKKPSENEPRADQSRDEEIYWDSVRELADVELLQSYIDKYPNGKYTAIATRLIRKIRQPPPDKADANEQSNSDADFAVAINDGTPAALQHFVDKYPADARATQFKAVLADKSAWQLARLADTQESYERYIFGNPQGLYVLAARERIGQIQRQQIASKEPEAPAENTRTLNPQTSETFSNDTSIGSQTFLPSFNCIEDTGVAEQAVCASQLLSRLDSELSQRFNLLRGRLSTAQGINLRNSQRTWIKLRNACGSDVDCLTRVYKSRIQQLVALGG